MQEAESAPKAPFAFLCPQEVLDQFLRYGSNTSHSRMHLVTEVSKGKPISELAEFISREFHGGYGIEANGFKYAAWYAEDGIHIARGSSARYVSSAQIISWEAAASRVQELYRQGQLSANVELAEASRNEREEIAYALLMLRRDLSVEAREAGLLSAMQPLRGGGFPEDQARLAEALGEPETLDVLTADYARFYEAYSGNRSLLRFHYHRVHELAQKTRELSLPRELIAQTMAELPVHAPFITEDEINERLAFRGSGIEGSRGRVFRFFTQPHTAKEKTDFLKDEYGIGGSSHALSRSDGSMEDHDGKGMRFKKDGCGSVSLSWSKVANLIDELIKKDRYWLAEEQAQREAIHDAHFEPEEEDADSPKEPDLTDEPLSSADKISNTSDLTDEAPPEGDGLSALYLEYQKIKEADTFTADGLLLYRVGEFYELFGEDADIAAKALGLTAVTWNKPDQTPVSMVGVPRHNLDYYLTVLRDTHDVTVVSGDSVMRYLSIDHEAEKAINEHEAEFGADGWRTFGGRPHDSREEQYTPRHDTPMQYSGADRLHMGREQEGKDALHDTSKPVPASQPLPVREMMQEEIDDALQAWNGRIESKRAVVRYMQEHGRERGTAAWLAQEFGLDPQTPLTLITVDGMGETKLPWPNVQRRIAQLIKAEQFYTQEEYDNLDDVDPIAVRDRLAESGIVNGEVVDPEVLNNDPFIRQVMSDADQVAQEVQPDAFTTPGGLIVRVGDTVYLEDGKAFIVEQLSVNHIQLRDPTLYYPIFRSESYESFQRLMELYPQPEAEGLQTTPEQDQTLTAQTIAFYPAEQNNLPFDVEIQTLRTTPPDPPIQTPPENFRITDYHLGEGGSKAKFRANMDAITTLKLIEAEGRPATLEEQETLSRYVGWGGLAGAFDESKADWSKEYAELKQALTPEEYAAARASTLNAHYTSPTVIRAIYEALGNMGFTSGNVLEPACGVGNFFGMLPQEMSASKLYGVELDSISGRIAQKLYPNANITVAGFESTDRRDFYDVAVGN